MCSTYYSHGKLLLTGEYAVLDGAISLAIPTRYGQSLKVTHNSSGIMNWSSYEETSIWFEQNYDLKTLQPLDDRIADSEIEKVSGQLKKILFSAKMLNPDFLVRVQGVEVQTHIDFNRKWGLGTSSTLINNVAHWAQVDPFELLALTFGGSGYDIACANHNTPILYQIVNSSKKVSEIEFDPQFKEYLYFVYLNKKQDSRAGISDYRQKVFDRPVLIEKISKISLQMVSCNDQNEFRQLILQHETLLSEVLELPTVQESLFPDFEGAIKSLGAWGGDFILATSLTAGSQYFKDRGYETVIPYSEMIL